MDIFAFDNCLMRVVSIKDNTMNVRDGLGNELIFEYIDMGLDIDDIFYVNNGKLNLFHKGDDYHHCLFLTNQCNSNCIMCPDSEGIRRKKSNITLENLLEQIRVFPDNIKSIDITGGEPTLLKNDLYVLIEEIFSKNSDVSLMILSNGRSFASRIFTQNIKKYNDKNIKLEIPIHSFDREIHDKIAGCDGSFDQTLQGIYNLHEMEIPIGIRIVVSKLNYSHLDKIIEFIAKKLRFITYINIMGLEMMGNAFKNKNDVWIDFDYLKNPLQKAVQLCFNHGIEPQLFNYPLCLFERKYWPCYRRSITPSKIRYMEKCDTCNTKDYCGGFFNSTLLNTTFECKPFMRG